MVQLTTSPCINSASLPVSLPVQVQHELRGKLHLYHSELKRREGEVMSTRSVCGKWVCGTPSKPRRYAHFHASYDSIALEAVSFTITEFEPCCDCFGLELLKRYGWASRIPGKDELMLNPLSEESDVSSSSSSSEG